MPRGITALIFDFDSTLVDSFAAQSDALQRVFSSAGIRRVSGESFLRDLRGAQFAYALKQLGAEEETHLDLFEEYRRTYWSKKAGLLSLYPGIRPAIENLSARSIRLAIVTQKGWSFQMDGRRVGASQELRELGMSGFFPVGVGFESVSNHKPHPEGIFLALERIGASPQECLVVGDSSADMEAAQAAGCRGCHAVWGIPPAERGLIKTEADFTVDRPEALLELPVLQ